ncbi:nuclear transport factor 2 family protein [Halpernia frigidisoli]|uniref:DUF4440 domain-containing protein n=1 Tax=Halpernia frigidisoli TaxID=1125876 RepID=A0A1I3J504_9FLAO|nr:nuclear transport factor 2 family protein [Halpernia frigidisoli]SFI55337.1 protein of unknown function [Halpernia frigidisoli]
MTKKKILFLLSFLMITMVFGQKKNDVSKVSDAAERLRSAMISGDKKSLEDLILPELTYGHSGGHIDDATEFVEKLVSKKSNFLTIDITNQTIKIVGKTAILRHHFFAKTADLGKEPGEVSLDILLVWVKTKGDWKLLARQAVKAEKKI